MNTWTDPSNFLRNKNPPPQLRQLIPLFFLTSDTTNHQIGITETTALTPHDSSINP